ncbi:MAG: DUF3099 domain-containing protein [Actinomycetota bacterium]|nr:DUF3099 domain-containing protein [Actinomycetota bacterium]
MLITSAPESDAHEHDRRKKRYAIMMGTRALCVLGAATTYHVSLFLALTFAGAGVILPWCAVILANDRPPRKRQATARVPVVSGERALTARPDDRTVDG